jgi:hypothetical protein
VFGAFVKVTTIDLLANVEHLRALTDVLACDLDRSDLVILGAIVAVVERKQRQQADDISEVLRLGRVRQNAASEIDRLLSKRKAAPTIPGPRVTPKRPVNIDRALESTSGPAVRRERHPDDNLTTRD